jgi:hypothetical protein
VCVNLEVCPGGHTTATSSPSANTPTLKHIMGGIVMRDIRSDLQERANFIEEQIRAAYAHFEKAVQQLQSERDARVADLQGGVRNDEQAHRVRVGAVKPPSAASLARRQNKGGKRLTSPLA